MTRDELVDHVKAIASSVPIPLNVDAERCFAETLEGIGETVDLLADAGAAGISIEDYNPSTGTVDPLPDAAERVAAAARACARHGILLTARAENHTIARLRAYREAGADAVYAPGVLALAHVASRVRSVSAPLNVLALRGGPSVAELAAVGVRRVSTGGALARAAYGALRSAALELLESGTSGYLDRALPADQSSAAFGPYGGPPPE